MRKGKTQFSLFVGNSVGYCNVKNTALNNDKKLLRYIRAGFKNNTQENKSLIKLISEELSLKLEKCPFCENHSNYEILYRTDLEQKSIHIEGLAICKNDRGMINYHCKTGKIKCPGSILNPNSLSYISSAYKISLEDAKKYLHSRNKSPFYKNNHHSVEDYKKSQSRNKDYYINKYGQEAGKEKHKKFSEKVKITSTRKYLIETRGKEFADFVSKKKGFANIQYFIEKWGKDLALIKFEEWKNSIKMTKERFIDKMGEEEYKIYRKNREYKKTLEYYIEIYGQEEGTKKYNKIRESFRWKEPYISKYGIEKYKALIASIGLTKDKFIEKHGIERWKAVCKSKSGPYSKESISYFDRLLDNLKINNIILNEIKWKEDEYFLYDLKTKRIYFYDLFLKINGHKILIEYDTPFMHPNRKYMKEDKFANWIHPWNKHISAEEKYIFDEEKKLFAKSRGYELFEVYIVDVKDKDSVQNSINELYNKIISITNKQC